MADRSPRPRWSSLGNSGSGASAANLIRPWLPALAATVAVLAAAMAVFSLVLAGVDGSLGKVFLASILSALCLAPIGALIAMRRPEHPVAWLLLFVAVTQGLTEASGVYAHHTTMSGTGAWPGASIALWLDGFMWIPGLGVLATLMLLLFPTGGLPSPRWRMVAVAATVTIVVLTCVAGVTTWVHPGVFTGSGPPPGLARVAFVIGVLTLAICMILSVASLFVRYRHGEAEERHQLKWVLYATVLLVIAVSVSFTPLPVAVHDLFAAAGLIAFPTSIAVSILRYRLYDIDVVISRTLVYGSLAALITAVYVGVAVGFGELVGAGGKPNLGLSILATAIVAVSFQPARERLQKLANRLVYGKRATPYEVLSQFSERVAESYASDDVLPRMARVLADGTNADLAEVWLRKGNALQRTAVFPLQPSATDTVHLNGAAELVIPSADRSVAVRHQGELLGALTVTKRRGETLTPIEVKLMDDLAHQAGLVLKNVGLTADLQARLVDLRASRQRLVAAQDDERRRLERNLHDGAQQHLVAIKVKLGLAEMLATRDPEKARAAVAELKHDTDEALETLRDLARGIYPPLLADKGLPTALQAQARKATLPVTIEADGVGRYPQDTEAALYFCILEALQNIQKYAQASRAVVRLRQDGDQLSVEVDDDGRGFDVSTTIRGNGLTNMEDRLDALGGTLEIASSPGHGTTLHAILPVPRVLVVS
jgi:signal transduction histidine kinase